MFSSDSDFCVYEKELPHTGFPPLYVSVSVLVFVKSATIIPSASPSLSKSAYFNPFTLIFGAFDLNIVEPANTFKFPITIVCVLLLVPSPFVPVTFNVYVPSCVAS